MSKTKLKEYELPAMTVLANPKSCLFCDHCTDVYYDESYGVYMNFCELHREPDWKTCNNFKGEN